MTATSASERSRDGAATEGDPVAGTPPDGRRAGEYFIVVGSDVARRVCGSLKSAGHQVRHLAQPTDEDLRRALDRDVAGVAVVLASGEAGMGALRDFATGQEKAGVRAEEISGDRLNDLEPHLAPAWRAA